MAGEKLGDQMLCKRLVARFLLHECGKSLPDIAAEA
jgi:hypothetical protein